MVETDPPDLTRDSGNGGAAVESLVEVKFGNVEDTTAKDNPTITPRFGGLSELVGASIRSIQSAGSAIIYAVFTKIHAVPNAPFAVTANELGDLCSERTHKALARLLEKASKNLPPCISGEEENLNNARIQIQALVKRIGVDDEDVSDAKHHDSEAHKHDMELAANALATIVLRSRPEEGISNDRSDIEFRRGQFGSNAIADKKLDSFLKLCWDAVQDFVMIMLIALGIIGIVVETTIGLDEGETCGACWLEGAAILAAVLIVVLVSATIDYNKQFAFIRLTRSLNDTNTKAVIRDGKQLSVVDDDIVVGDILSVNAHNMASIPADCVLLGPALSGGLQMDESTLTGESVLITKHPGDVVLSGTTAVQGSAKLVVVAVGINSVAGKIKARVYESSDSAGDGLDGDSNSPLFVKLESLAKRIGMAGTAAALLSLTVNCIRGFGFGNESVKNTLIEYIVVAITVLAVAVPEGLPLAVTLALAFSSGKMMKEQNLVKHLDACETMGCATTICTDKTGTLTANKMTARAMFANETDYSCTDPTMSLANFVKNSANRPSQQMIDLVSTLISICSMDETVVDIDRDGHIENSSGNPTEVALLVLASSLGENYKYIRDSTRGRTDKGALAEFLSEGKQIEFSSARKMMSYAVPRIEGGYRIYCKGASEVLISRCNKYFQKSSRAGEAVDMNDAARQDIIRMGEQYARRGMRTLTLAYRDLPNGVDFDAKSSTICNTDGSEAFEVETGLTFVALVGIEDPLRPEVPEAIGKCYEAGIDVRMVTGDSPNTAVSIAYQAGILKDFHFLPNTDEKIAMNLKPNVLLEGKAFRKRVYRILDDGNKEFDQTAFDKIWPHLRVLARSSPDDKITLAHGLNQSTLYTDKNACRPDVFGFEFGDYVEKTYDENSTHYTFIFNSFVWMQLFNEINARSLQGEFYVFRGIERNPLFCGILVASAALQVIMVQFGSEAMHVHKDGLSLGNADGEGGGGTSLKDVLHPVPTPRFGGLSELVGASLRSIQSTGSAIINAVFLLINSEPNAPFAVTPKELGDLSSERTHKALARLLEKASKNLPPCVRGEEENLNNARIQIEALVKRIGTEEDEAPAGGGHEKQNFTEAQKYDMELAANALATVVLRSKPEEGISNDKSHLEFRREQFGSNAIADKKLDSFLKLCWEAVQDFVLVMLIALGIIGIVVETTVGVEEGETCGACWLEGAAILAAVLIVVLVTATIDYNKQFAFVRLTRSLNDTNTKAVIRDGKQLSVIDDDIVVGDILSVNAHNMASIPADCVVLGPALGGALQMDESTLTGESVLITKHPGDVVLSGTTAVQGSAKLVVVAVGINSVAGKIKARVYESTEHGGDGLDGDTKSPLFVKLETLAKRIGMAGTAAALLSLTVNCIRGFGFGDENPKEALIEYIVVAITVLAVAVPEGLPLAVTLALAFSSNKMMKEQNLVKHLDACETMGCATTICTDKTGTLTANKMTARAMYANETDYSCTDPSMSLANYVKNSANRPSQQMIDLISTLISICSMDETVVDIDPDGHVENSSGNPTEVALLVLASNLGENYKTIRESTRGRTDKGVLSEFLAEGKQFGFSSARKMMSYAVPRIEGGYRIYCKGASEVLISRCNKYFQKSSREGEAADMNDAARQDIIRMGEQYARRGMRTLTLAYRDLPDGVDFDAKSSTIFNTDGSEAFEVESGLTFVALVGIEDPLRPEVPAAIGKCYDAGIDVRMVTGDSPNTAVSIAYQAGILKDFHFLPNTDEKIAMNLKPNVLLEGKAFRRAVYRIDDDGNKEFDQTAFDKIWPHLRVLARSSPDDKITLAHGPDVFGFEFGDYVEKTYDENSTHYTFIFNSFVWMQLFNEINSRSLQGEFNVFRGIERNPLFCGILVASAALQVVMVEFGGKAMHVSENGLDAELWGYSIAFGFGSLPVQQVINVIYAGLHRIYSKRRARLQAEASRRRLSS
ncbi:hypothetical protein ACHAWU_008100 [Discostella pseudostelligera]|uniref:P-type Ca(2+) transporter n=1 Tax=Discostella pseudostelligera TaxID=259834 RepID=A0ABD3N7R8_9STRA